MKYNCQTCYKKVAKYGLKLKYKGFKYYICNPCITIYLCAAISPCTMCPNIVAVRCDRCKIKDSVSNLAGYVIFEHHYLKK